MKTKRSAYGPPETSRHPRQVRYGPKTLPEHLRQAIELALSNQPPDIRKSVWRQRIANDYHVSFATVKRLSKVQQS